MRRFASKFTVPPSRWGALPALTATPVFAHTAPGETTGFLHGLLHLIGGTDHIPMLGIALLVATAAVCLARRRARSLIRFGGAAISAGGAAALLVVLII